MFADIVWSAGNIAVTVVIVLALIGLVLIAARQFGVTIPQWVWQVIGICFAAFVIIVGIKFVLSL